MKIKSLLAAVALCGAVMANAFAATVTLEDHPDEGFFDIFYTVSDGAEFLNWELTVTPSIGEVLDPIKNAKSFNAEGGAPPMDTFVNTVFSSVGAGAASYNHSEYNPGSAFPPVPADENPRPGGTPDQLRWTAFDTATGDGNIDGFFPYHMARVLYTPGIGNGGGIASAWFFDSATATGGGEVFDFVYGIPEPASIAMAGMGLVGMIAVARRRK